jgi:hypothetical protein
LLYSRELLDNHNDIRLAIVEGVTAAEVYIEEAMQQPATADRVKFVQVTIPGFGNMKASEQLALLALVAGNMPRERVELECAAWDYRNKVVHDGWSPNAKQAADVEKALESLILVLGALLGRGSVRVMTAFPRNAWMTPVQWEAEYKAGK